ncbi:MAG: L-fucose/L-arabinose isomerase family protein [Dehalobacterium sp.]
MTNSINVALIMLGRPQFDIEKANRFYQSVKDELTKEGVTVHAYDQPITMADEAEEAVNAVAGNNLDAYILVQGTFTDATLAMAVSRFIDRPLLIWATKEQPALTDRLSLNSFCGLNLSAHALYAAGKKYKGIYGEPACRKTMGEVMAFVKAAAAINWVKGKKIGLFGHRPKGYYPSNFPEIQILEKFGVTVEYFVLDTVFKAADALKIDEAEHLSGVKFKEELNQNAVSKSVRAYVALKKIIEEQSLDAVAIECWPDFMNIYGGAVCFAVGKLNDDGIVAACEADICGAISMLFAQYLSGQAVFLADLVAGYEDKDELVFWHCGAAPRCLAACKEECYAGIHPNRRLPLSLYFPLKDGLVTVSRLSPGRKESLRLLIGKGEGEKAPMLFNGNSMPVKTERPVKAILDNLVEKGFEHHYVISYGNITAELKEVARLLDLDEVEL